MGQKSLHYSPATNASYGLLLLRMSLLTTCSLGVYHYRYLNTQVAKFWEFLSSSWWFQSVYFETVYVVFVYAILILIHGVIFPNLEFLKSYRLHSPEELKTKPNYRSVPLDMIVYMTPFALLDTFLVKKYTGVPAEEINQKWASGLIQTTRLLPKGSPTLFQICTQLCFSFLIYDAIFFVLHYSMHRSATLYRLIHAEHHDHPNVQSRVTNKLSVIERVALVLSANESLKLVTAHPLTRFAFVPFFVWGLVENHSGFDFPWSADKVVPFGLIAGSRKHFEHHFQGARNYQPFFTYIDNWLNNRRRKRKAKDL